MAQYRKKPVIVDAVEWSGFDGNNIKCVRPFFSLNDDVDPRRRCDHCDWTMDHHGWVDTLEGGHIVCPGDYIITGAAGEQYPCKPDIFEVTYERVY